jgi:two-component system sensor histidine kinase FlrB
LAATSLNAGQLQDAFQVFNQHSGALQESYRDLQNTVEALTTQVRREQAARLHEQVKKEGLDRELTELRQRSGRLQSIGEMTADFSHQVRTPLASAMLYAGLLETDTPTQAQTAKKIVAGLNDLHRMVNDMLGFAAGARQAQERVSVVTLLDSVRRSAKAQMADHTTLRISVTDSMLFVAANETALQGALLNLVINADQAGDGPVNILLHGHRFGDSIHLCVTDNGPGVADEIQSRMFEPFYTTRPQGTGLGLSVVDAVATAHGGRVTLATSKLGTTFTIQLPVGREPEECA